MRLEAKRWATFLLCPVALAALAAPAVARTSHRHAPGAVAERVAVQSPVSGGVRDDRFAVAVQPAGGEALRGRRRAHAGDAYGGYTSDSLVSEARKYLGTNPTGRRSLWCGAFMDMVLKHTGHAGGGNLASAYAHYGTRVSGPEVGAIAVMGRRGGGHVGVVSGIDPNGNPIIVSGNHNRTVAESVYPRGRIAAYVMPGG
jgi:uncharacterized protein (TIGR02594 family)